MEMVNVSEGFTPLDLDPVLQSYLIKNKVNKFEASHLVSKRCLARPQFFSLVIMTLIIF
jgi:hypothetical protein